MVDSDTLWDEQYTAQGNQVFQGLTNDDNFLNRDLAFKFDIKKQIRH